MIFQSKFYNKIFSFLRIKQSVFPDYGLYMDFFEEIGPNLVWKVRFCIKVVVVGEICNMGGAKMS